MPRVRPLFPDPVCKLPDEYGFVAAVLAAPLDDLPKLVYADWLDERDDPRGAFLRAWLAARKTRKKLPKPDKTLSKCWLSVIGYTFDEWSYGMDYGDRIRPALEPCLVVRAVPLKDGETLPTAASKMGGLPDRDHEPDDDWPEGANGPAAFVAQWNLAELAVSPCCRKLPKTGLLSFFIDMASYIEDMGEDMFGVQFYPDVSRLVEEEPYDDLPEGNELPACRVEFREWLSVPDFRSPAVMRLRLPKEVLEDYSDFQFGYPMPKGSHRILGHAGPIQNDPSPAGKRAWSLLTQLGPDEGLRLEACDGGTWYFMTPAADLKKGKFDDTEMEFQTG